MASRYESDMTRKEKMQLEKEKLSKMNFKEKLAYIWEYYKAVIFGIIAVIFIIGTIVNIHENAKYYDLVSIAVAFTLSYTTLVVSMLNSTFSASSANTLLCSTFTSAPSEV